MAEEVTWRTVYMADNNNSIQAPFKGVDVDVRCSKDGVIPNSPMRSFSWLFWEIQAKKTRE